MLMHTATTLQSVELQLLLFVGTVTDLFDWCFASNSLLSKGTYAQLRQHVVVM